MRRKGIYGAGVPSEGKGVGVYHIDPREVFSQVFSYGLCRGSDVVPSGVSVPHTDRPGGRRVHETN